jgi:hypothetical protein
MSASDRSFTAIYCHFLDLARESDMGKPIYSHLAERYLRETLCLVNRREFLEQLRCELGRLTQGIRRYWQIFYQGNYRGFPGCVRGTQSCSSGSKLAGSSALPELFGSPGILHLTIFLLQIVDSHRQLPNPGMASLYHRTRL